MRDRTMSAVRKMFALIIAIVLVFGMSFQSIISFADESKGDSLSLDDVTIDSFKIIDKSHGDAEIDYSYALESNPDAFANIMCIDQSSSVVELNLGITYQSANAIKEGDELVIPAVYGGRQIDFVQQPLLDANGNTLGTWQYVGGEFVLIFGGEFINNNVVNNFSASFVTGELPNGIGDQPKTFNLGERIVKNGKVGNKDFTIAYEKCHIVAEEINNTYKSIYKLQAGTSDTYVHWYYRLWNDYYEGMTIAGLKAFYFPYFLSNNGAYKPDSFTDIYIEDTIYDAKSLTIEGCSVSFGAINDDGKIISGAEGVAVKFNSMLDEVSQGSRSRDEVKADLQKGQYCLYQNADGTTTVMIKWYDMNDDNGFTYSDIPEIQAAGGVGNFLKARKPDIYGILSDTTIQKINQTYDGKALQHVNLVVTAEYPTVVVPTVKENTATISTEQTGEYESTAKAKMTPAGGISDAPSDPLAIKLVKTDSQTASALSEGFKFELETSTDGGTTWTTVTLDDTMMDKGVLNDDNTVTPDADGTLVVKKLIGGQMYRFVETVHPAEYQDVIVDNDNPNAQYNEDAANSEAIEVTNQGEGHVVVMYNKKRDKAQYVEEYYKEDPAGTVEWNGKKYSIVAADTNTQDGFVGLEATLMDRAYTGFTKSDVTYQDSENEESTKMLVVVKDGSLVVRHYYNKIEVINPTDPVKDVFMKGSTTSIDGKEVKAGDELTYVITYKNTTGDDVSVSIKDTLPAHTTLVSVDKGNSDSSGKASGNGTTLMMWNKKVADGETFTVSFTVKVDDDVDADEITNTAIVKVGDDEQQTNTVKNTTPKATKKEVVNTADSNNMAMYAMLFVISIGVLSLISMKRRSENK